MTHIWTLEPLYQSWRISKVLPYLPRGGTMLDIGCDTPPRLINQVKAEMKACIGLDIAVKPYTQGNVSVLQMDIEKKLALPAASIDVITLLAVLEHIKRPQQLFHECYRLLKPGGVMLVTTPTPACKPLAEFLARIHLLRQEMIDQHEHYFTGTELRHLAKKAGFTLVTSHTFELGLNNFLKATR